VDFRTVQKVQRDKNRHLQDGLNQLGKEGAFELKDMPKAGRSQCMQPQVEQVSRAKDVGGLSRNDATGDTILPLRS
jgi:hypothetical protein